MGSAIDGETRRSPRIADLVARCAREFGNGRSLGGPRDRTWAHTVLDGRRFREISRITLDESARRLKNSRMALYAIRGRSRNASHASMTPAAATTGSITRLTRYQPKWASIAPETNEPIAMVPKMRKSLKACTLVRSSGR